MGRKKKYETPEELQKAVDLYFDGCEQKEKDTGVPCFPDCAGMLVAIGMKEPTVQSYISKDHEFSEGFKEVFDEALLRRESYLSRASMDNKKASGCFNLLKQPKNGGYIDRPQDNGPRELTIKFEGNIGKDDFK